MKTGVARDPWDPQEVVRDLMHSHVPEVDHGQPMLDEEIPAVASFAVYGVNRIDVTWVEGWEGMVPLLWPMRLGRGDNA